MPLGPWELAIILVIIVIIFGAGKLPEIGGALGQGIREFKASTTGDEASEGTATDAGVARQTVVDVPRTEPVRNETAREEI